ncbi:2-oxo-4-hydroxy-4-carboxy-5-ureidoimidazoline decarboxylase-like [Stylophora pistillata]|nr:2-oxo-4-hydroxy-4-carboxy-5-ureidoimidazoline decarboxylase-like [Stylophora pistillata]
MASQMSISTINALDFKEFIRRFGNVVEGTSLCAAALFSKRPFASFDQFVTVMWQLFDDLPDHCKEGILRNHRDLASRWEALSAESKREQTQAGISIKSLSTKESQEMEYLNEMYKKKFEFPFVICSRLNNKEGISKQIRTRLNNDKDVELKHGIEEVKKIVLLRMKDLVAYGNSKL